MKGRLLSARTPLIREVADLLHVDGRDYSDNLVVFPGKRPAHHLRKFLAERAGGALIPPRIFSMDGFAELLAYPESDKRPVDALDAVSLLFRFHISDIERIGGSRFSDLDSFFPVALKLYGDLEELLIEQVPPERIRGLEVDSALTLPEGVQGRLLSLASYLERFYDEVRQRGMTTRSLRYRAAAAQDPGPALAGVRTIVLAGFFQLTASELCLFKRLLERDQTTILCQDGPGIERLIQMLGITVEREEAPVHKPEIRFVRCPDIHGEVACVGAELNAAMTAGRPDERTAVILPSAESLFPLLRHALQRYNDEEFNITLGYPLVRTPLFGFFASLGDLLESAEDDRLRVQSYVDFLLHPYTKNILFETKSSVTRILFHSVQERFRQERGRLFVSLETLESDTELGQLASRKLATEGESISAETLLAHLRSIHDMCVRPFLSIRSVGDFAEKCLALLDVLNERSSASRHPLFYPFAEFFGQSLEAMRASLLAGHRFTDFGQYFALLKRYMGSRHVPFDGTPLRGMQVLGMLETRALQFDRVVILDANEGLLPQIGREDSLLPSGARERLGLPTYRERDRLAHYYFSLLVGSAEQVTICWVENDRMERSRFVERLVWEREQHAGIIEEGGADSPAMEYNVHLAHGVPRSFEKNDRVIAFLNTFQFSASSLDAYLKCPLRFYFRYVLGLQQAEQNADMARAAIGVAVHAILTEYLKGFTGRQVLPRELSGRAISPLVRRYFRLQSGEPPRGNDYLIMMQVERRLSEFVDTWLTVQAHERDVSVVSVERLCSAVWKGWRFRAVFDALMVRGGRPLLLDFKTGARASSYRIRFDRIELDNRASWGDGIGSVQLPLYRLLLAETGGHSPDVIDASYLILGTAQMGAHIEEKVFAGEMCDREHSLLIQQVIEQLLREIQNPSMPFSPAADLRTSCGYCDFHALCGTQWIAPRG